MKKRLEEAENFYGSIRKMRHKMKNHMANIKGLTEAGIPDSLERDCGEPRGLPVMDSGADTSFR